jgi:hypothetical protein
MVEVDLANLGMSMRTADDRRHKRAGQWVEVVEEPSLPRHEGRMFNRIV